MDPFKYQIKMTDVMNMGLTAAGSKQAKVPRKAAGLLLFKHEQKKFQREEQAQKAAAAKLFLTQPEVTRGQSLLNLAPPTPPPEDDLDLEEPQKKKLEIDEIKKRLYQRECTKLGITPVGAFLREPTQTQLAIRHYGLDSRGAKALAVPLMLDSTLTSLDLEGNALGPEGLAEMAEMLTDNCSISHLNLKRNKLGARGASLIVKVMLSNRNIVSLNLSANDLGDKEGVKIAELVKENKTVTRLDLSDNSLGYMAGAALGDALGQNEHIENLDLSWNKFREAGAAKLLKGVTENVALRRLCLAYNACGRSSCKDPPDVLGPLLQGNQTLTDLDLQANRLTDQDFVKLSRGVLANETLTSLKVGHNLVSPSGAALLLKSALTNEGSRLEMLDIQDCPVTEEDLADVKALRERGCDVIHGRVLEKEADLRCEPKLPKGNKSSKSQATSDGTQETRTNVLSSSTNKEGNREKGKEKVNTENPLKTDDVGNVGEDAEKTALDLESGGSRNTEHLSEGKRVGFSDEHKTSVT